MNRTFVLDTDLASRAQSEDDYDRVDSSLNVMTVDAEEVRGIIYPMYDMVDVHVKSAYKNSKSNLKSFDAKVTSKREDIYLPQLTQDPIGYCQI